MKPKYLKLTGVLLCIALLIFTFTTWFWLVSIFDHTGSRSFDRVIWLAGNRDERTRMSKDLLKHHLKRGMHRSQLEAMLGTPDQMVALGRLKNQQKTVIYDLGGLDHVKIEISLDVSDCITGYEFVGY